jgi:chemotaxis protein CheY-P-specific phosphatase CheC
MSKQAERSAVVPVPPANGRGAASLALKRTAPNLAHAGIAALEAMIRDTVVVKSQRVYSAEHPALLLAIPPLSDRLAIVSQRLKVDGQEVGTMSMVTSVNEALAFAALVAGWNGRPAATLNRADADALKELANILLGRSLDALGEVLTLKPTPSLPALVQGTAKMVRAASRPAPNAICIETCLIALDRKLELMLIAALDRSILRREAPASVVAPRSDRLFS